MYNKLTLKNFKRHANLEVNFHQGSTAIVGENYSGKSSVFHGLLMALFGVSAVPDGKLGITRGESRRVSAALEFTVNNKDYEVKRTLSSATLYKEGVEVAKGTSVVNEAIEELLGVSKSVFLKLFYSEQKKTERMMTEGAAGLHKLAEEVTGADIVEKVSEAISEKVNYLNGMVEGVIVVDDSDLISSVEKEQIQLTDIESTQKDLNDNFNTADAQLKKSEEAYKSAQEYIQARDKSETDKQLIKSNIVNMKNRLRDLKSLTKDEVANYEATKASLVKSIEENTEHKKSLTEKVSEYIENKGRRDDCEHVIQDLETALKNTPAIQVGDWTQDWLSENIKQLEKTNQDRKSKRSHLQNLLDTNICPTCKQSTLKEDREQVQTEIEKLAEEVVRDEAILQRWGEAYSYLVFVRETNEAIAIKKKTLSDTSEYSAEAQEAVTKELQTIEDKLSNDLIQLERVSNCLIVDEENWSRKDDLNTRIVEEQEKLENIPEYDSEFSIAVYQEARDAWKAGAEKYATKIREDRHSIQLLQASIKSMQSNIDSNETARQKVAEVKSKLDVHMKLLKFLRANKAKFMDSMWQGVLGYASQLTSLSTDGYIEAIGRDEKGNFFYREQGIDSPMGCASGGQKSIMGLSVQIALSRLLPSPVNGLLLDEPTADLNERHSMMVSTMLRGLSHQIITVSHTALDVASADSVVTLEI